MNKPLQELADYVFDHLGHCMVCIRQSFRAAGLSWIVTLLTLSLPFEMLTVATLLVSLGLTLLWVLHLVAYSTRMVIVAGHNGNAMAVPSVIFFQAFAYVSRESTMLYRPQLFDRSGRPAPTRTGYVAEVLNRDGTRTVYFKTRDDVAALVAELRARGVTGRETDPEYWMSTDSCQRSSSKTCSQHTCDDRQKACKSGGAAGFGACGCQ